jgi:hypothetical protein
MESFDPSLKLLLHRAPASSIQLASGDTNVRVLEPIPTVLPSRGRDVDSAYLSALGGGAAHGCGRTDPASGRRPSELRWGTSSPP